MDEKTRNELALFKFSLIAPIVNGTLSGSIKDYLEHVCAKTYEIPGKGPKELSPNTVQRWLFDYRRFGLEGLKRKPRNDKGAYRALSPEVAQAARELKQLYPCKTATAVYAELKAAGLLGVPPVSLSTIQRYLRKLDVTVEPALERKRFVFESANDCWQTDALTGPYLRIDGRKRCTYLIVFLDDASRLVVHGEFFFAENSLSLQTVLKKALLKRGIPKRIFADNGKIFNSLQLRLVCAELGIVLSHARPFSPSSKGKVERLFRTVRMQFLNSFELDEIGSLAELNSRFLQYVESTYNLRPHSGLDGASPMERYLKDKDRFRFVSSPDYLDRVFLREVVRKVNRDATISVMKKVFEVPQVFIGRSVKVRFDPENLSCVFLKSPDSSSLLTVYPVRPVDNAKIIRKQNQRKEIDFVSLYGGESR